MANKVYEIVTENILKALEKGIVPWRKPWNDSNLPHNYISNRQYSGINLFLLAMSEYSSPYWLTFKQAKECGGSVKTGEKGRIVVFWKIFKSKEANNAGKLVEKTIPMLRYYTVFNTEQCENLREIKGRFAERPEFDHIEAAEKIVADMPSRPM
jgi:antirestriction protein ArdC